MKSSGFARKIVLFVLATAALLCATAMLASAESGEEIFAKADGKVYVCGSQVIYFEGENVTLKSNGTKITFSLGDFSFSSSSEDGVYCFTSIFKSGAVEFPVKRAILEVTCVDGEIESISASETTIEDETPVGEYIGECYDGFYMLPCGTNEFPWRVGKNEENDDIYAFVSDGFLYVFGCGEMRDFENYSDRPWDSVAGDIRGAEFDSMITHVGKNAFAKLGGNIGEAETFNLFMYDMEASLETIGDGAFEGLKLDGSSIMLPKYLCEIGSRAFADTGLTQIDFYGSPEKIAPDAFAGVTADATVVCGVWNGGKGGFGGNLKYTMMYRFEYSCEYVGGDMSASGVMYIPEGETLEYTAESYEIGFRFARWEIIEGALDIDTSSPDIAVKLSENVVVKMVFEKGGTSSGEDPEEQGTTAIIDIDDLADEITGKISKVLTMVSVVSIVLFAFLVLFIVALILSHNYKKKKPEAKFFDFLKRR